MANIWVYVLVVTQDRDQGDKVNGVFSKFEDALATAERWRENGTPEYITIHRVGLDGGYGPSEKANHVESAGYEMYSWFEEH